MRALDDEVRAGKILYIGVTGLGRIPGEHAGPVARLDALHRPAGALQPAAPRHRTRAAQVAIAWTKSRSPAVHPIIGARNPGQLTDNLAAAGLELPAEALARLDAATQIDLGFPATFINETSPWVFGAAEI